MKNQISEMKKRIYLYIIALLLLIPVFSACTKEKTEKTSDSHATIAELMAEMDIQHIIKPVKAPDFELLSVKGEKVSLGQYRGKVVLLSFWATW
jgi:cytochrome oxidase Cu insertion factor (SCO1/SenC/PrrC family)